MESPDPWTVLSVLIGLAGLAPLIVPLNALEHSKSRWLKQTTSGTDAAPREIRRQHRKPATQPPRTYRNTTREVLARSIRCSGRVPIDQHKNRPRPFSVWQKHRDDLVSSSTKPKSAFTLTDWQYQPITPTGLAKHYPYCGGSMLRLSLHPHENRSHLKRSLKADKSGARARRLVVIASVQDMFEPTSLVRCIVVNSKTLHLEKGDPPVVVLRTADPLSVADNVYTCEQENVPADALWLIVPTTNYRAPSTIWGQIPERHNNQTTLGGPETQESDDVGDEDFVKQHMTERRQIQFLMWFAFAPVTFAYIWAYLWAYMWCFGYVFPQVSAPISVTDLWLVVYVIPLIAALSYLAVTAFRAGRWRRRDDQTRITWHGRTEECLIMGAVLRNGPFFSEEQWKEHYAHTFQMSDKAPTGST